MRQLYTSLTRASLKDILAQGLGEDSRSIGELLESELKKERILGKRLECLYAMEQARPGMIVELLADNDWHDIRFYKDGEMYNTEVLRSREQAQRIFDAEMARRKHANAEHFFLPSWLKTMRNR